MYSDHPKSGLCSGRNGGNEVECISFLYNDWKYRVEYTACFTGRSTRRILGEDIDLSGSLFRGSAPAFAFGERDSPCADVPEKKKSLGSSINCLKVVSQCITYPYYGQNHDSYNKQPVLFIQIHTGDIELSDIAENDSAYYCHRNRFF